MGQSIHTSQVILPPPLFMLSLLFVLPSCGVVVVLHDAERDSQYTRPKSYYRHLCLCYPYYLSSQVVELLLFWMMQKGTVNTHVASHITATSVCVIPTICPPKLGVVVQLSKGTIYTHIPSHITATSVCVIPTICPPKLWSCCSARCRMGQSIHTSQVILPPPLFVLSLLFVLPSWELLCSCRKEQSIHTSQVILPPPLFVLSLLFVLPSWELLCSCRKEQSIPTSQVILPPPLFVLSLLFDLPSWELLCSCRKEQSIPTSQVILPPPLFVLSLLFLLPSCGVVVLHDAARDSQYTRPKSYYRHLCLCYPYYLSSQVGSCCAVVERNNQYPRPKSYYRHLCLCYPYYLSSQVGSCCAVVERNNQYPRPKSYYRHLCLCYPYYLNSQVGSCCAVVERNNLYPRPKSYYRHLCLCYPYYFSSQIVELLFCMMQQGTVNTHVPSHITATSVCVIPTICPPKLGVVVQLSKGTINTHVPSHITATSVCVIPTICPLKLKGQLRPTSQVVKPPPLLVSSRMFVLPSCGVVVQLPKGTINNHVQVHNTAIFVCVIPTVCPPKFWNCTARYRKGQSIPTSKSTIPPFLIVLSLLFVLLSFGIVLQDTTRPKS
ncbi:hypothetical protein J6590_039945 [Homalodisca vitripennis]|nr:hypothetical protein J6590_039945 [Homalodisca vitripennis]